MLNMNKKSGKDKLEVLTFNTKLSVIEKKNGIDPNSNSDKKLGDFLKEIGYKSLADMLRTA